MTEAGYGTWGSPVSSKVATEAAVCFQEVHVDQGQGSAGGLDLPSN